MFRTSRTLRTTIAVSILALSATACGGSPASSGEKPSAAAKGDGILTFGTLLPQTGDLAFLAPPGFAGIKMAIQDINQAGGVLGNPVKEVLADSGDGTPDIAGASVDRLLDDHADVILGAHASSVSLSVIDKITGAGVVEFSSANTSPTFDDPSVDPKDLYFRTSPSDVLQGAVLANTIIQDGHTNIAILARQDSYGELLATQAEEGVRSAGASVASKQLYAADATNFTAEVNQVAASHPDALVLIGFDETKKIIPELIGENIGPADIPTYFVDGNTADYSKDFPKGTLKGVKATFPGAELSSDFKARLLEVDPKLTIFNYGPESYDAVILSALAAVEAKTDEPTSFAPHIITVSKDGTECSSFEECVDLLEQGEDIDYQGVSGPCDLGENGSPVKATISILQFGDDNTYKPIDYVTGVL